MYIYIYSIYYILHYTFYTILYNYLAHVWDFLKRPFVTRVSILNRMERQLPFTSWGHLGYLFLPSSVDCY